MFKESGIKSKLSLSVLAFGLIAFAVGWLWSAAVHEPVAESDVLERDATSTELISSIQPISEAEARNFSVAGLAESAGGLAKGATVMSSERQNLSNEANEDLRKRFAQALKELESDKVKLATNSFNTLIADYPGVPELYVNLGAIYARNGELNRARQTLTVGLEQSDKSKALFTGLQEVHGALAANAYQKALDATSSNDEPSPVSLPLIASISTAAEQDQLIASLQVRINDKQSDSGVELKRINALEAELSAATKNLAKSQAKQALELKELREQLTVQSEILIACQASEREAQARVVRAEESASAQVAEAETNIETEKQSLLEEKDALIAKQAQSLERLRKQVAVQASLVAKQEPVTAKVAGDKQTKPVNQDQAAIALVRNWARVWSAQDVSGYVGYYADDYTSGDSISRAEWLNQRQERLTNKDYIDVEVSEFEVNDMGKKFAVTFKQHYRSNTVDDTTVKRLVFDKVADDWSQAKIVDEARVQG